MMSETRSYDESNGQENPDEYAPPVRRRRSFLASRGYDNPEIAVVKFGLAEDIQRAVARLGGATQAEIATRVRAAGVPLSQLDVFAILNGNLKAFALESLMQVAAALGTTVTVSSKVSKDGTGHRQLVGLRLRWRAIWTACPWLRPGGDAGDLGPNLKGLGPGSSILGGWNLVTAEVEEVVDPVMGGQETLRLFS
jgi:hypothetical protein